MKSLLLNSIVALFLFKTTFTFAQTCNFHPVEKLKVGSEISTFVYDYWNYNKDHLSKAFKSYPFILKAEGAVAGDYHFGNLGIYFNTATNQADLAIIDMDDSGRGNQFSDLMKLLLSLNDKFNDGKLLSTAMESYFSGLNDKDSTLVPPQFEKDLRELLKALKMTQEDFEWLNKKEVASKMDGKKFAKDKDLKDLQGLDSIRKNQEKNGRKYVEEIGEILDSKYRINPSGSSKDAYRFVYLVKTQDSKGHSLYVIAELKENNCPGTVKYAEQKKQVERFELNKKDLQSENYWQDAQIIDFGDVSFLLRIKKQNPLEDLVKNLDNNSPDLEAYVGFYSYTLGRIHAPTANAAYVNGLETAIKDNRFHATAKAFVEAYDTSLKERINEKKADKKTEDKKADKKDKDGNQDDKKKKKKK